MEPWTASEDFPVIPTAFGCPYLFWTVGITPRRQWARAEAAGRLDIDIPSNHNPGFLPDLASLPVTTESAAVAVLACLGHQWRPTGLPDDDWAAADWAGEPSGASKPAGAAGKVD
jgi:hippurate hydrolase